MTTSYAKALVTWRLADTSKRGRPFKSVRARDGIDLKDVVGLVKCAELQVTPPRNDGGRIPVA